MAAPRKYPLELKEQTIRLWRSEQLRRPIAHVGAACTWRPTRARSRVWLTEQTERIRGDRVRGQPAQPGRAASPRQVRPG